MSLAMLAPFEPWARIINFNSESNKTPLESSLIWLGMRDSNPRMVGPEPTALPLGESPSVSQDYTTFFK